MDNKDHERDTPSHSHSIAPLDLNNVPELPRENLISTAIKFLQNPKVISSALSQKRAFLKSKGLTENEIDIAIQRSGATNGPNVGEHSTAVGPIPGVYQGAQAQPMSVAPVSGWTKLRDTLSSVVLMGGVAYAIYYVYQKYIAPYLFGKKKSKLDLLEEAIAELKTNSEATLTSVRELQQQQQRSVAMNAWSSGRPYQDDSYARTLDRQYVEEIKGEIKSLKALLLTPRQFPQAPATKPLLPEWQLTPSSSSSKLSVAAAVSQPPVSSSSGPPSIGDSAAVPVSHADDGLQSKPVEEKDTGLSFGKLDAGLSDGAVDLSKLSNGSHEVNGLKADNDE